MCLDTKLTATSEFTTISESELTLKSAKGIILVVNIWKGCHFQTPKGLKFP